MEGMEIVGTRPGSAGVTSNRPASVRSSARGDKSEYQLYDELEDSGEEGEDVYADLDDSDDESPARPFQRSSFGKTLPPRSKVSATRPKSAGMQRSTSATRTNMRPKSAGTKQPISLINNAAPPKGPNMKHSASERTIEKKTPKAAIGKENSKRPSSVNAIRSTSAERALGKGGAWLAASTPRRAAKARAKAEEILATQNEMKRISAIDKSWRDDVRPSSAPAKRGRTKLAGLRISVNKDELMRRLKRHFATKTGPLMQSFTMMDANKSGYLTRPQLRSAFERSGMRLMPGEMDWLFENCQSDKARRGISYVAMTQQFHSSRVASEIETGRQSMYDSIHETNALTMAADSSTGEVKPIGTLAAVGGLPGNVVALFAKLQPLVQLRYRYIWTECVMLDEHRTGKINLQMLAEILKDNGILQYMTRREYYELLKKQRNASGLIDYAKFLHRVLMGQKVEKLVTPTTGGKMDKKNVEASVENNPADKPSARFRTSSVVGNPVRGTSNELRALYRRLQPALRLCWRDVRREMKAKEKSFGLLSVHVFQTVLANYGADLSSKDFLTIMKKHSSKAVNRITPAAVSASRERNTFYEGGLKKVPIYKKEDGGGIHYDSFFRAVLASK